MSYNLSGLAAYIDATSQTDLVSRAILKPQSVNNLTIKAGLVSGTTNINILGANTDIKDASCGFGAGQTGSNTTIFTTLPIVVGAKMLKEQLCPDQLYDTWISSQLSPDANHTSVPFEQAIVDLKIKEINKYVEQTIYAGDGASLDGLVFQTSVGEGAVDGTAYAPAWTAANAVSNMWGLIDLIPTAVKQEDDLTAFVSYATYSKLVQGLQDKGNSILLQYPNVSNVTGAAESSFIFPGSNVKIFAAPGLTDAAGESTVFCGPKKYVFLGTGILDNKDSMKAYYDASTDFVNFLSKFRIGTAAVADQFVSTKA